MILNKFLLYSVFILSFSLISKIFVLFGYPIFGYLKYISPCFALLFLYIYDKKTFQPKSLYLFYISLFSIFSIISVLTLVTNHFVYYFGITNRNIFNIFILFAPLISCFAILNIINFSNLNRLINILFLFFSFLYFLQLFKNDVSLQSLLHVFSFNFFFESDFDTESGLSLVFCLFSIYYFDVKNKYFFILAVLFTLLGGKRIAMIGILFSFLFYFLYPVIFMITNGKLYKRWIFLLFIFGFFSIGFFWEIIYSREYDGLIKDIIGMDPNVFFMGRLNRFSDFYFYLPDSNSFLMGYGLGYAENVFYNLIGLHTPIHNDYFRFFLELGPILFFIWLFIMFKFSFYHRLSFALFILLIVLMQTDNVIIYDEVMYTFYLLFSYSFVRDKNLNSQYVK